MDGLPIALAAKGHRVMTIAPRWDQYYDAWDTSMVAQLPMETGGSAGDHSISGTTHVRFFHCYKQKVDRVFVDHPIFLEKVWGETGQKYYGPAWGSDWNDSQVRFSLFSRAALQAIKTVPVGGYPYGENCVVVCNDWHTALLPLYMHLERSEWQNTKLCLLIHNMVYQGRFAFEPWMAQAFNLPESMIQELRCHMPLVLGPGAPKADCVNWLRGSLRYFDRILTVSPTYAQEIMSSPLTGVDLNEDLRSHKAGGVLGILNGIKDDCTPSSENMRRTANLTCKYDESCIERRSELKAAFQKKVGLPVRPDIPLFMFIGRLDYQKGVDILLSALEHSILPKEDIQMVVIGQGREDMIAKVTTLKGAFPDKLSSLLTFKGLDKYSAYAACEFALIPSRYEPCGLVQMEGMRFGVLPVVTPIGGLKDTVEHMKTGIMLRSAIEYDSQVTPENEAVVADGILSAMQLFQSKDKLMDMQRCAMTRARQFTWAKSADQYLQAFASIGASNIKHLCGQGDAEVGEDQLT